MAMLVVIHEGIPSAQFTIDRDEFILGRDLECQLHAPFSQAGGVSRRHARIVRQEGVYYIEDLASRNGTLLNGQLLDRRTQLNHRDQLSIGGVALEFRAGPDASGRRRPGSRFVVGGVNSTLDGAGGPSIDSAISMADRGWNSAATEIDASRKLAALVALLAKIGQSLDVDDVFHQFLEGLFDVFPGADHGVVAIRDAQTQVIELKAVRHRSPHFTEDAIQLSQTIVDRVLGAGEAILSANAQLDERFGSSQSLESLNIRSLMCVPLIDREGNRLGILQLNADNEDDRFDRQDLEVLASITPHAVRSMEYARLHSRELKQQALRRDLEFAREIQRSFLPNQHPQIPPYEFFSFYEAAYEVGGDYYDYIELDNGKWAIVVADIAGKGVSAALLMSKFAGELKYVLSRTESLGAAIERMNNLLCADESRALFITMAVAVLDPQTHEIELVNAGHTDPLHRLADGTVVEVGLEEKGIPLGMIEDQVYRAERFVLGPGDTLLIYTDGLNEATRADESLFGIQRIKDVLTGSSCDVNQLGEQMIRSAREFVGKTPQSDDMCVICFQHRAGDPGA